MSLKGKVKFLRDQLKMTQTELAAASSVTHATISRIESGHIKDLKSEALKRLANALGVSLDYLTESHKSFKREAMNTPDLQYIVQEFEKLSYKGRTQMKDYINFLAQQDVNVKNSKSTDDD